MALDGLLVAAPPGSSTRRESLPLPGRPSSVPQARRFVRDLLRRWDREIYEEAGSLLVSELVTNAVLHARSEVVVELAELDEHVLLSVTDASPTLPVLRRHGRVAGTGRGLWLLEQYSSGAGVQLRPAGAGKQVWAVLCPEVEAAQAALADWLDTVEGP